MYSLYLLLCLLFAVCQLQLSQLTGLIFLMLSAKAPAIKGFHFMVLPAVNVYEVIKFV